MIQAEIATTLDPSELTARFQRATLINGSAYCSSAPWKYTAFIKLHDLEFKGSVSKSGPLLVSTGAVKFARTILDSITEDGLPTPAVCPVLDGSVGVIWTVGLKQLEAIFGPDKTGSYVLSVGDEVVDDGEIVAGEYSSLVHALEGILAA